MRGKVVSFYLRNEELWEKIQLIARDLGYASVSEMLNDVLQEIVAAYEILEVDRALRSKHLAKQKIVKSVSLRKIFTRALQFLK